MSRTKSFLYNSVSSAILQLVTMLGGFILPRVMLVAYGSEINGLVSSVTQFLAYFTLVEAGISGAAVYALYRPLAQKDCKEISGVIVAARKFYNQSGALFVALTVLLAIGYPFYIRSSVIGAGEIAFLVLILGVNGALEFFTMAKYRVLLTADQKTYVLSVASTVHIALNTLIVIILAHYKVDVVLLKLIALFSIFLRSLILHLYCRKKYSYINYREEPNHTALRQRWDALYLQILGAIQNGFPIIVLTLMLKDLKQVSVYAVYSMLISGISGILNIFISGLAASFGDIIAKREQEILKKSYKEFEYIYYILITIVYAVTFITIMPFVFLYTQDITDVDYNIPIIGFLFVLNGLLYSIKTPQGMLVISAGLYKETKWQTTIQGLIAIGLSIVLVPYWGITGVLIGAILSNIYRDIDLLYFIPRKVTETSIMESGLRMLRIMIGIAISYLPFLLIPWEIKTFKDWLAYVFVAGTCTFTIVVSINIIFEKQEMRNVLARMKGMVKQ